MIVGIGVDLFSVTRAEDEIDRPDHGLRDQVFTPVEIAYCESKRYPGQHYAARFAAKEAVSKCFSTGIGAELGWRSVSVYHGERQQPLVRLDAQGEALLRAVGATHVHLTLSHTENVALAVAALVRA